VMGRRCKVTVRVLQFESTLTLVDIFNNLPNLIQNDNVIYLWTGMTKLQASVHSCNICLKMIQ
jgi:hypothetical protein